MAVALTDALAFVGVTPFTIQGIAGIFSGHYDPGTASRTIGGAGKPGFKGAQNARILAPAAQFSAVEAPVERTLANKIVTVKGLAFRIASVQADALSLTFNLENVTDSRS